MSPEVGDINFWISGDTYSDFSKLWCDLVFVIQERVHWRDPNSIASNDPIVDSPETYADHYPWTPEQHPYRRRCRFTLKADPAAIFQPQEEDSSLINLAPL